MCIADFWVNVVLAICSFLTIVMAVFGEQIRYYLYAPKLCVELQNSKGEFITQNIIRVEDKKNLGTRDARYYHLIVSNSRREIATDVQVCLQKIENHGPDGNLCSIWEGDIPLRWKDQEMYSSVYKNIGPGEQCDFCLVNENRELKLLPLYYKNNLPYIWSEKCDVYVTVFIKYRQGSSKPIKIRISWDGLWDKGENEMMKHLIIRQEE